MSKIHELQLLIEDSMFSPVAWTQRNIEYREHLRSQIAWIKAQRE